jgi:ATP synthase protein I
MTEAPKPDAAGAFETRLLAARTRQGLECPDGGQAAKPPGFASVVMRSGAEFGSAIGIAALIGYFLDRALHTRPVLMVVFVLLGWAAGILNVRRALVSLETEAGGKKEG